MLNFFNPAILFALAAGAIPLIIHLLNRQKQKEVRFSTIEFIKQMAQKEMRRLRLWQLLLLLLRTLILLLLVLAFARPTLTQSSRLLPGRDAAEVVVLVDNSLSMSRMTNSGTVLTRVKEQLLKLGDAFKTGDQISLITLANPLQPIVKRQPFRPDSWEQWINKIDDTPLTEDLPAGLYAAGKIMEGSDLAARELYIISDFQKKNAPVENTLKRAVSAMEGVRIFLIPVEQTATVNISVDSVLIRNQLVEVGAPVRFSAVAANHFKQAANEHLFNLFLNEENQAQTAVSIGQNRTEQIDFQITQRSGGYVSGRIEAEPDEIVGDNHFYFNYYVPEKIRILHFLAGTGSSVLTRVLQPAVRKGLFQVSLASIRDWASQDFFRYDVILFEGLGRPAEGLLNRLRRFNETGGAVIIFPADNPDLTLLNRMLKNFHLGRFSERVGSPGDKSQSVSLSDIPLHLPLFEGLLGEKGKVAPVNFFAYFKLISDRDSEKLLRFNNGDPFLIQSGEDGNIWLSSAPLRLDWTELPLRGFIVPLIYRLVYAGAVKMRPERLQITVGEPFEYLLRRAGNLRELVLEKPDGSRLLLYPQPAGQGYRLEIPGNRQAGHYRVFNGEKLELVYSANHSPAESVWQFYTEGELADLFPNAVLLKPASDESFASALASARMGRELWGYLLLGVLFLLALEMLIAYRQMPGGMEQKKDKTVFSAE